MNISEKTNGGNKNEYLENEDNKININKNNLKRIPEYQNKHYRNQNLQKNKSFFYMGF